jgi:hypothetical protein
MFDLLMCVVPLAMVPTIQAYSSFGASALSKFWETEEMGFNSIIQLSHSHLHLWTEFGRWKSLYSNTQFLK